MSNNPLVSILIPAYRPQWLDLCICSCLSQTYSNFEIIIGDDSNDGSIFSVVNKWNDPRIQLHNNELKNQMGTNVSQIFQKSKGQYIKFVFDDDFLFPESIQKLVSACEQNSASMSFHLRAPIDENGVELRKLSSLTASTEVQKAGFGQLDADMFWKIIINKGTNVIGEPSNCLFTRELMNIDQNLGDQESIYWTRKMLFLGDVKFYTNAMLMGRPLMFVPEELSAFRQHTNQATHGKTKPAGYYEWDIVRRHAFGLGLLDEQEFLNGLQHQKKMYNSLSDNYKYKGLFQHIAGSANGSNDFLTQQFDELIKLADEHLFSLIQSSQ